MSDILAPHQPVSNSAVRRIRSQWRRFLLRMGRERRKVASPDRCTWAFPTGICTRCGLTVWAWLRLHIAVCPEYGGKTTHHMLMARGPRCLDVPPHVERRRTAA